MSHEPTPKPLGPLVKSFAVDGRPHRIVGLPEAAGGQLERLPHILRILLENVLRHAGEDAPRARDAILTWLRTGRSEAEIPFLPGRVMMHDTTCGPALVDIAGMRAALAEAGHDPGRLNQIGRASCRGKSVDLGGRRIIKKKTLQIEPKYATL